MTEVERMLLDTLNRWNKTRESESKQYGIIWNTWKSGRRNNNALEDLSERVIG